MIHDSRIRTRQSHRKLSPVSADCSKSLLTRSQCAADILVSETLLSDICGKATDYQKSSVHETHSRSQNEASGEVFWPKTTLSYVVTHYH